MRTGLRVVTVSPADPRPDRVEDAVGVLRAGGVLALPTETFYGLAADAFCVEALIRVNRVKQKPPGSPILLLLADPEQAEQVADPLPHQFEALAQMFWPGPLTLVVPASPRLPDEVSGGRGTVAIRVPGLALPRRLARALGRPISGVSANIHAQPPSRTPGEVARTLTDGLEMILDGGPTTGGAPSTILDLTGEHPAIVRHGTLPTSALSAFLPDIQDPR